jgi:hypothetical protein
MPAPFAPLVIVIQLALLTAVHEQLVPVETPTAPLVVPVGATFALVADRVKAQLFAACVTVNVMPAIVIVPTRELAVGLAATA